LTEPADAGQRFLATPTVQRTATAVVHLPARVAHVAAHQRYALNTLTSTAAFESFLTLTAIDGAAAAVEPTSTGVSLALAGCRHAHTLAINTSIRGIAIPAKATTSVFSTCLALACRLTDADAFDAGVLRPDARAAETSATIVAALLADARRFTVRNTESVGTVTSGTLQLVEAELATCHRVA